MLEVFLAGLKSQETFARSHSRFTLDVVLSEILNSRFYGDGWAERETRKREGISLNTCSADINDAEGSTTQRTAVPATSTMSRA